MRAVFTYQTLHLNASRVRFLERHIEHLNTATVRLFGVGYNPNREGLLQRILALEASHRHAADRSVFIQLRVDSQGGDSLHFEGISLYDGYVLRSLSPRALVLDYQSPLENLHTSSEISAQDLAREVARARGYDIAAQRNYAAELISADGSPLVGVRGRDLFVGSRIHSCEIELAITAAKALEMSVVESPIPSAEVTHFDELMMVDYRGLTGLKMCNGHLLMSIIAEKLAAKMEQIVREDKNHKA